VEINARMWRRWRVWAGGLTARQVGDVLARGQLERAEFKFHSATGAKRGSHKFAVRDAVFLHAGCVRLRMPCSG
jgi:hypothetical protein